MSPSGSVLQDGAKIRELRIRRGLPITWLARSIGRHPKTLQHIEHETRGASEVMLSQIATALGTDPEKLRREPAAAVPDGIAS
jgi:plasmid maintenance system antidote protein VapI